MTFIKRIVALKTKQMDVVIDWDFISCISIVTLSSMLTEEAPFMLSAFRLFEVKGQSFQK